MNTDILIEDIRLGTQSDNMAIADFCNLCLNMQAMFKKRLCKQKLRQNVLLKLVRNKP